MDNLEMQTHAITDWQYCYDVPVIQKPDEVIGMLFDFNKTQDDLHSFAKNNRELILVLAEMGLGQFAYSDICGKKTYALLLNFANGQILVDMDKNITVSESELLCSFINATSLFIKRNTFSRSE